MPQYALPAGGVSGPVAVTASPHGGTITSGGTFQIALGPNAKRKGGFIQNNSSDVLYVFTGVAGATQSASVQVSPGLSFNLNMGTSGYVYTGTVWVDGTTAAAFTVMELT